MTCGERLAVFPVGCFLEFSAFRAELVFPYDRSRYGFKSFGRLFPPRGGEANLLSYRAWVEVQRRLCRFFSRLRSNGLRASKEAVVSQFWVIFHSHERSEG